MTSEPIDFAALCALVSARLIGQGGRIRVDEVGHIARANGHDGDGELRLFLECALGCVVEGDWIIQPALDRSEGEPRGFRPLRLVAGNPCNSETQEVCDEHSISRSV